jgi:hypothetical protein
MLDLVPCSHHPWSVVSLLAVKPLGSKDTQAKRAWRAGHIKATHLGPRLESGGVSFADFAGAPAHTKMVLQGGKRKEQGENMLSVTRCG